MNAAVFKNTLKRNWKLLVVFLALLCFYLAVIISLVDVEHMEKTKELFGMASDFLGMFSISVASMTSPLNYTASVFFSVLVMALTMVFYVLQASGLIARQVEDGSLACTLSAPVKRGSLALTRGVYLICCMAVLFIGIFTTGAVMLGAYGSFDMGAYANLVGVAFMLCTAVAMLSYFLSAAFCDSRLGTRLAVGVPVALLFVQMLGGAGGEKTEWLKRVTPFGWLDSVGIVTGAVETWWMYWALGGAAALFLAAAVLVFKRKRLPL